MAGSESATVTNEIRPFEDHVKKVLQAVRVSLVDLISSVGADPLHSQDMARRFGLNKNMCWKISKIIREEDLFAAVPHIPGKSGSGIFLRSMNKAGAPKRVVQSFREAIAEFDEMVRTHSGDRATLDMMLGNVTREGQKEREEAHRRLAFQGNSATWGVQARAQLCVNVIAPSHDENLVDLAWLSGLVDFRRLRHDVPWAMASARKVADDGAVMPVGTIEAIDPEYVGDDKAPLLSEFCSSPLPKVRVVPGPDGLIRYELSEGPVGNTAALSCMIGLHGRAFVRRTRAENDTLGEHAARLYTPVETLIHDFFIHEELEYAMNPSVHLYSMMPGGPAYPTSGRDAGKLPLADTVNEIGNPTEAITPSIPHYRRMLGSVIDRLGWDAKRFRGFRLTMRYPPIPAIAIFRYELP